jgi:hypothetical protein
MSSKFRDKREAAELLRYLHDRNVLVWRDDSGDVNVSPATALTETVREELVNLQEPLRELLEKEEVVIIDPEEQSHSDLNSAPAPEMNAEQKILAATKAAPRSYQGGAVLVNSLEGQRYGYFIKKLARERERQQAIENGDAPRPGYYKTGWDLFNRREYE